MAGVDFETCSGVPMGKISALGRRRSGELLGNSTNCLTWILPRAGAVCMCLCVCVCVWAQWYCHCAANSSYYRFSTVKSQRRQSLLILQLSHLTTIDLLPQNDQEDGNCQSTAEKLTSFLTTQSRQERGTVFFPPAMPTSSLCNMSLRSGNECKLVAIWFPDRPSIAQSYRKWNLLMFTGSLKHPD